MTIIDVDAIWIWILETEFYINGRVSRCTWTSLVQVLSWEWYPVNKRKHMLDLGTYERVRLPE